MTDPAGTGQASSPAPSSGVALVTGGTGFVGSHLVDALVEEGWRVRCLVRPSSDPRWLPRDRIELARAGLDRPDALRDALADVRVVFHLAGLTSATSRVDYTRVNVEGTRGLLAAVAARSPDALVVFCSSLAAAGPSPDGRPLTEADPPRPAGPYGESKLAAERLVQGSGLDHVVVRPPAVYGPRDPDILAAFRLAAWGLAPRIAPADQRLSLVHVRDLAHGFLDAAERGAGKGVFYMSDGGVHTWSEVIAAIGAAVGRRVRAVPLPRALALVGAHAGRLVARVTGRKPLLTPERVADLARSAWVCDDSRARRELGYETTFGLADGMRDTAAWYRDNRWLRACHP
ncbi:MAG TPA: NAD-dependent epimerase/dehydratase family protein [Gemmatimonadota bacterium]